MKAVGEERFVDVFDIGFQRWIDVREDLLDEMRAAIGHVVRPVQDQFPQVLDADEILVVDQTYRTSFLLQFLQIGIDRFEETIEAAAKTRRQHSPRRCSDLLHSEIGE